jgi:hypothetical protein
LKLKLLALDITTLGTGMKMELQVLPSVEIKFMLATDTVGSIQCTKF